MTSALSDPGANGILKRTALNTAAIATPGTDYYVPGAAIAADLNVTANLTLGAAGTLMARLRLGNSSGVDNFQIRTNCNMAGHTGADQDNPAEASWALSLGGSSDAYSIYRLAPGGTGWNRLLYLSSTGFLGLGYATAAPAYPLVVSQNVANAPAYGGVAGSVVAQFAGIDSPTLTAINPRVLLDAFNGEPLFTTRRANGTAAAPTAILSGHNVGGWSAYGYGTTGYGAGGRVNFLATATEDWTDTAQGCRFAVWTTTNGTVLKYERMTVDQSGYVGIGRVTPTTMLDVNGTVTATQFSGSGAGLTRFRFPACRRATTAARSTPAHIPSASRATPPRSPPASTPADPTATRVGSRSARPRWAYRRLKTRRSPPGLGPATSPP